jgi:fumarate hydratase class II
MTTRTERDSMGDMQVSTDAYYGASTARAVENFPVSSLRFSRGFIRALGLIKSACATINFQTGHLTEAQNRVIQQAADEVIAGKLDDQFVVDIFQTGSGTSTNMNANEVIASRANELATGQRGGKVPVHPNDHVNMQQSSNDVIPTAIHISAVLAIDQKLVPALTELHQSLAAKANEFDEIVKIGRTHLQDATPVRMGQVFGGYAAQAKLSLERAQRAMKALRYLPLGGTAVGTGINSHPDFARQVIEVINAGTQGNFAEAENHFEAQSAKDAIVEASGLLKAIAISLGKIANDIRLMASGPRCGLGELNLPAAQPGSSIMPGKVNPVMSEMLLQVCAQVVGNDATIVWSAAMGSTFELNVMMPVMAYNLLQSIELLSSSTAIFSKRCISGLTVNRDRCESLVEQSLAMCTSLAPLIGYDKAAEIAKESYQTGKTVREIAREKKVLSEEQLARALDPRGMTEPG